MIVNGTVNLFSPEFVRVTLLAGDEVPAWAVDRIGAHLIADNAPTRDTVSAVEPVDGVVEVGAYDDLKRAELVALAKDRGLDASGKVVELRARLVADDESGDESDEPFDPWTADGETLRAVAAQHGITVGDEDSDDELAALIEDALGE